MENPGKETYVEQMERVNQTNPFMLSQQDPCGRIIGKTGPRSRAEITEDSPECHADRPRRPDVRDGGGCRGTCNEE